MSWFKVDDGLHSHPKVIAAGNAAVGLWTRFGSYCSSYLTDGFVPETVAKSYGKPSEIRRLIDAGMIRPTRGGYVMHDFHDYNPTSEKVQQDRADAAERQRQWREKRQREQDAEAVKSQRESQRDTSVTNTTPTRPDPTRPASYDLHRQSDTLIPRACPGEDGLITLDAYRRGVS